MGDDKEIIESMAAAGKGNTEEKPARKNRGKMRREEKEAVRRQLREMRLRGIDRGMCMTVLILSRRQYEILMSEIRDENIQTVKDAGIESIGEKLAELDMLKEYAIDAWHGAKTESNKVGFLNNAIKAIETRHRLMVEFGLVEAVKTEAQEEKRKARNTRDMTLEELEEEQKRILESLKRRNIDGRFDALLEAKDAKA
jgi:hypothetical protein